jgi:hypothetical protein
MDTLLMQLNGILTTHVVGKISLWHVLAIGAGSLIPVIIGIILPRKKTIQYGILINKTLGLALLQKRHFGSVPTNIIESIIATIQTTFQDMSFGVYIDARKDLSSEEKQNKISEYLVQVPAVKPPEETKPAEESKPAN